MRLPSGLSEEQIERLRVIAAKCPVHRVLDGEVMFEESIELVAPARAA
jgi:putative redox protein